MSLSVCLAGLFVRFEMATLGTCLHYHSPGCDSLSAAPIIDKLAEVSGAIDIQFRANHRLAHRAGRPTK